ncbi:MAG: hypothetical protein HQL52_19775 [Magnetococcales bacterium]|nr:hypothetical protein [Magnetococcales bacterium]
MTDERPFFFLAPAYPGLAKIRRGAYARERSRPEAAKSEPNQNRLQSTEGTTPDEEQMLFDTHTIQQVIALWQQEEKEDLPPLFSDHVQRIMETVFLAGLHRVEDHPVTLSVTLTEPVENLETDRPGENIYIRFGKKRPFTVDTLDKLAMGFDPLTTALGVSPVVGTPQLLEIWGAIFTSRRGRDRFDPLPFGIPAPDLLTISTFQAGSLSFFRENRLIARFNAGRLSEPASKPFTSSLMGWNLLERIKSHSEFKRCGTKYWYIYRHFIDRLLLEGGKLGHGGTIVWMPNAPWGGVDEPQYSHWMLPKHILLDAPKGAPLLEDLCAMEQMREENRSARHSGQPVADGHVIEETVLECKRKVVDHAELLANLTRLDGALIIDHSLRPISFGTILAAPHWPHQTLRWPDERMMHHPGPIDLSRYGTRHNSAVNFVGQHPGAVVFVISQDGPVVGLTRKDDTTIFWWPDCLGRI